MAVKLRLMRFGKRNRPCYRLCAVDARAPRDGAYIESIGFYDPFIEDDRKKIRINKDRAEYWLRVGAQPSETVLSFLRKANVSGLVTPQKPRRSRPKKKAKVVKSKSKAKTKSAEKKAKKKAKKRAKKKAEKKS